MHFKKNCLTLSNIGRPRAPIRGFGRSGERSTNTSSFETGNSFEVQTDLIKYS